MPRYEVTLTPTEVQTARTNSDKILAALPVDDDNYTSLSWEDRFFVGECGELAVRKLFDDFGIVYEHEVRLDGHADKHDFTVYLANGEPLSIDVKNSHYPKAARLMVPLAQFERHHHDSYIGCTGRQIADTVEIIVHGIVSRGRLTQHGERIQRRCMSYEYPLYELTPLNPQMFKRYT